MSNMWFLNIVLFINVSLKIKRKIKRKAKISSLVLNTLVMFSSKDIWQIFWTARKASSIPLALKNIQAKHVQIKTIMPDKNGNSLIFVFFWINRSMMSRLPCIMPQATKFHLAPCHKPLRKKTINKLIIQRTLFVRLPPNGIYT